MTPTATPKLLFTGALLVFLGYLGFVAQLHLDGRAQAAAGGTPFFNDFSSNYAASQLVRQQPAEHLYLEEYFYPAELAAANAAYAGTLSEQQARVHGYAAWMYPPLFILFCLPLAAFPHLTAYLLWLLVTALPYAAALRLILPGRYAWPLLLAAPPTFFNLIYGQTGYLSAGLIGLGLGLLQRAPTLAGLCIGLAAFKPQFGILLPLALAAGGYWWVFTAASVTLLASIAATVIAFGAEPWWAFIGTQVRNFEGFGFGAYNLNAMITPYSSAQMLGLPGGASWLLQLGVSLTVAALVIWSWRQGARRDPHHCLRPALLCGAALLATPMAYLYDMPLLVLATAWLWQDMCRRGYQRWEPILIVGGLAASILLKAMAQHLHIQLGPLPSAAVVALSLYRSRTTPAATNHSR